jgi:hypothetical protein
MRQVWVSMMKLAFRSDDETCGTIDHLGGRIDNIAKRRNDTIHRLWYIGLDDDKDKGLKNQARVSADAEGPRRGPCNHQEYA